VSLANHDNNFKNNQIINLEVRIKRMDTENLKMRIITVQTLIHLQEWRSRLVIITRLGKVRRIIIIISPPAVQTKNLNLSIITTTTTTIMHRVAVTAMVQGQLPRVVRTSRHLETKQMIESWRDLKNISQNSKDRIFPKQALVLIIQMTIHDHLLRDKHPRNKTSNSSRRGRRYVDLGCESLRNRN